MELGGGELEEPRRGLVVGEMRPRGRAECRDASARRRRGPVVATRTAGPTRGGADDRDGAGRARTDRGRSGARGRRIGTRGRPAATASTSLMTLLEQADGHWDESGELGGASRCGAVDDNEEDSHRERHEEEEEEEVQVCCVCMVRHKGATFIPCGHTFCRLCSRELRHTRGNCPLCNVFIQDILHIF
ncbi:e3 ubiquitin-protein ligase xbat35 [Hordeum vulgare]|nr:e3 ubiquitin-protein ligase xbat35 [Hordeum vulgare]